MNKFDIIKTFDDWRWEQDSDVYNYEISTYCFDTKLENKSDEERKNIAKKILLTHHLLYICDRQMDYRFIFYYGGYVVSKIVEDFLEEKENKQFNIENFIKKHTYSKPGKNNTFSHYLKVKKPDDNKLMLDFVKQYDDILHEKSDFVVFASRMTIIDYYCIFRTLQNYQDFIDSISSSDTILELAESLFKYTYKGIKNKYSGDSNSKIKISGKEIENFLEIYRLYEKNLDNNIEFKNKIHELKRLWCVIRDFIYHPIFKKCLEITVGENKRVKWLNDIDKIELPGDVWNNNVQFAKCMFGLEKKNFKSSVEIRKIYENNKEEWGACCPIHFDITFAFVPRMCSVKNCETCPLAKYSKIKEIKENSKDKDWRISICHGVEGKYCTLALFATGFKYLCKGKENCNMVNNNK